MPLKIEPGSTWVHPVVGSRVWLSLTAEEVALNTRLAQSGFYTCLLCLLSSAGSQPIRIQIIRIKTSNYVNHQCMRTRAMTVRVEMVCGFSAHDTGMKICRVTQSRSLPPQESPNSSGGGAARRLQLEIASCNWPYGQNPTCTVSYYT